MESKGRRSRAARWKWEIPLEHFVTTQELLCCGAQQTQAETDATTLAIEDETKETLIFNHSSVPCNEGQRSRGGVLIVCVSCLGVWGFVFLLCCFCFVFSVLFCVCAFVLFVCGLLRRVSVRVFGLRWCFFRVFILRAETARRNCQTRVLIAERRGSSCSEGTAERMRSEC